MPVFSYKVVDKDDMLATGTIIADSARQARDILRERGLVVAQLAAAGQASGGWFTRKKGRRGQTDVVVFVRELATLLQAGIQLLPALKTLERQHSRHFRAVVQHLVDGVAAGMGLADAMGRQDEYFDQMCVSLVRVGESTGSLDTALNRLADYKEKTHQLRSRITTALIYPAAVCVVGLAVSIFLMTFVVPNLMGTLEQTGRQMPAITRFVKGTSDFLLGWWWLLLMLTGVLAASVAAALRTVKGRYASDWLVLRLPIIGQLVRMETTSRMAVVLSALLRGGLQFIEALRVTKDTLRNQLFRNALVEYEKAVAAGRDVAEPLAASGVFSPMVVQIVAVGQQAGELENMLDRLAEAYDRQVAIVTQRLTAVLEPLLIVMLAVMVGFIALATILPILEVSNAL